MTSFLLFLFLSLILTLSQAFDTSTNHIILSLNKPTSDYVYGEWIVGPNGRYYQFNTARQSWLDSREYCLSHNADLVTLEDGSILIGLIKNENHEWTWGNGNPFVNGLKFANESAEGRCAGIVLGEVKMKTLNCTDAGKESSRFICERDKAKHEEQQKTSNYMYDKLQQLFDYFGIGGGNKDKDEKKHLQPEIDYEETMKEFKEIKSNETETKTTTKKQETSREEQATVNKAAVQQPKDTGESTSLKELEEGSGQSEGIQVERNAIEKIEQGEKKINDLIARLESMVKKIEDEEKVKEEKKLKALEVERAALQGKEKEEKGNATTLPANTDHVTAPVNSTVSVTTNSSNATTTTPFTTITTAGKEKKVEDEDLLVTQKTIETTTTTAAPTSATTAAASTSTTTQIPATEEQGREEKRMVNQIEDDFMETNNTAMPVADLTPPLEDCKEEETAKERRVKKVLQTVKTYLDRATKDDLLSLLNSTTEENLLQKLEEGIAAANKREFQMAQLLKDHRQEEFLQVEHPTENFMTDEEREALYNRISSTIIRNIEQQKEASKKTTQAPSTTSNSSNSSPSPSTPSTAPSTKSKLKIKGTKTHEVTSSRKSHHPSVKSKKTKKGHKKTKRTKTKTKSTVNGKEKISKTKEVKGNNSTVTEGKGKEDEVAESNAVFMRANRVKKGEQELNSTEEELTDEELNSLTKQEDQIAAAYKKTIGEIRKLNAEERQIVKAEQIERRNQRRTMKLAAARRNQLQNKLEEEEDDEKPDRPFKAAATHKAVTRKAEVIRRQKLREKRRKILLQRKKQRELRRARRNKILKLRAARQKALLEKKRKAELTAKTSTTTTTTTETSTTTKKAKSSRKKLRSKARKLTTTTEEPESEQTDEETEADYYGSEEDSGKHPETEGIEEDIKREREKTTTKEPEATTTKSILSSFPKMSLLKELFEKNKAGSDPLGATTSLPTLATLPSIDKVISDWQENISKLFPPVNTATKSSNSLF